MRSIGLYRSGVKGRDYGYVPIYNSILNGSMLEFLHCVQVALLGDSLAL